MSIFQTITIAIVEGLTEFLPVSSTGHMILAQALLNVESTAFVKAFTINIQLGAILSVLVLYWKRFFQTVNFYVKLLIAFIPAAIIGFFLGDYIDRLLESVFTVALMLVLGGIAMLFVDKWFNNNGEQISNKQALQIGFAQCVAMIPGVSRSAATIVGGMASGLNRKTAAEFSFFLAVPTMFAASAYKLLKDYKVLFAEDSIRENLMLLGTGNLVAFIVGVLAIRFFISYLTRYGFKVFGWYRIIVGGIILILLACDVDLAIL
ncbi:MAG: undecaprenyl-diphosphate phosphatase [Prevotellaceae bacterium]|jgi:undecaprenyl-diphosphatase|nr:undecaprenyl-diphosphate phosphatase [Prevotellaceae bacterium]